MGATGVEVTRAFIERYNRRDIPGLVEITTPDFQFKSMFAGLESGGVFRGHQGLAEYFEALGAAYEQFELDVFDVVDAGAATVVPADAQWCGNGSGARGRTPVFPVLWLRGDKVMRIETFADRDEAFAAAGLTR